MLQIIFWLAPFCLLPLLLAVGLLPESVESAHVSKQTKRHDRNGESGQLESFGGPVYLEHLLEMS